MPITYKKTVAVFDGNCEIEEAEELLAWLIDKPKGKLNLKNLQHTHTAVLQVMLASNAQVSTWPQSATVKERMQYMLTSE